MKVTGRGETIEQAIEQALTQLQTTKDQVEITVVDEGKKSFLGLFGGRQAVVEVVQKEVVAEVATKPVVEEQIDPMEQIEQYLQTIIRQMGVESTLKRSVNGKEVTFSLSGEQVALLIGKRGATLNSLQFLTQLAAHKFAEEYVTVIVDAEGYRMKRKEVLERLAKRVAKDVKYARRDIEMDPMPSFERKIVHQILGEYPNIETTSVGQEPNRSIVVRYNRDK